MNRETARALVIREAKAEGERNPAFNTVVSSSVNLPTYKGLIIPLSNHFLHNYSNYQLVTCTCEYLLANGDKQ